MRKSSKVVLLFFLTVFAVGCEEYSRNIKTAKENKKNHPEQRVFDGEIEPQFPSDNDNNKTLLGVDSNHNGIRDDIDIWINYVGISYNHRMALRQLARQEVSRLSAGASKSSIVYNQVAKDYYDGSLCVQYMEVPYFIGKVFPSSLIIQLTYNNAIREKAYEQFHESSLVYKSNIEDINTITAYRACNFKIEKLQEIIDLRKSLSK